MGYHEMVEDVGDGIRKLAFSDGNSDNSPRLEKPAHSKSVFYVFVLRNNRRCSPSMERLEVERFRLAFARARLEETLDTSRRSGKAERILIEAVDVKRVS